MKKHVLFPVEFREARERLFRLLLETASKTDTDFVLVHCDQVFLTPEGAELVAKLTLHLITLKAVGSACAVATFDDVAYPVVGILVSMAKDSLKGGLLLQSRVKGPKLAAGTEVVMITDVVTFHTTSHISQLRGGEFQYRVNKLFVLVDYHHEEAAEWVAQAGLELTSLFTHQELKTGELDYSRFHLV